MKTFGMHKLADAAFTTVFLVLCLLAQSASVQLNLDHDVNVMPGNMVICGIISCSEEVFPSDVSSSISSLTLFKGVEGLPADRRRVTVASLSQQQTTVNRLWNGVKADGKWTSGKAEVKLYLTESDDCRFAEFSCEVRFKDGLGNERTALAVLSRPGKDIFISLPVSHASVLPLSTESKAPLMYHKDTSAMGAALQLSSIIQQVQISLAGTVQHLQGRVEDKINDLDKTVSNLGRKECTTVPSEHNDFPRNNNNNTITQVISKFSDTMAVLVQRIDSLTEWHRNITEYNVSKLTSQDTDNVTDRSDPKRITTCARQNGPTLKPQNQIVTVYPGGLNETPFLCDLDGGWTIIQRRTTGDVDFYIDWASYKMGFGSLDNDFWLGNDRIHNITSSAPHELRVKLKYQGKSKYARYESFSIGNEEDKYRLQVGSYDGTAGDALTAHNKMYFTTFDRDNDNHKTSNCARLFTGAWWYSACHSSNLNGEWGEKANKGPSWNSFSGSNPVTFSEMSIRPKLV